MKKFFVLISVFALLIPFFASAHTKWLVNPSDTSLVRHYQWTDGPVIIWLAVVFIIIAIGVLLEYVVPSPRKFSHPFFDYIDPIVISLFSIMTGIGLIVFSILGYVFAPPLVPTSLFGYIIIGIQACIGLGLVLGVFVQTLSLALIILYLLAIFYFGIQNTIEALEIPGIALMLLLSVRSHWVLFSSEWLEVLVKNLREYAVPLLRIFVGFNFIVLGFSEKILRPELGVAFLSEHHWNFMQILGFQNFTDYWFVLSAGVVEALFGLVFVLGIVTRINAFVVFCFFIPSFIMLGSIEIFGHILYFATLMVLMVFGSGNKLKLLPSRTLSDVKNTPMQ